MNGPPHSRPKCLTLRSRSAFCEGKCSAFDVVKRQAPLREGQAFSSSFGRAPLPFWPGLPAQLGRSLAFPHTVSVVFTSVLNDTLPPLAVIPDKDPPSLTPPGDYIPRRRFALWSKQAFHPCNGLCGGMGSMAAAWPYLVYALLIPCM